MLYELLTGSGAWDEGINATNNIRRNKISFSVAYELDVSEFILR
jgi:hypothetical protein